MIDGRKEITIGRNVIMEESNYEEGVKGIEGMG